MKLINKEMVFLMNIGVEVVEIVIKIVCRWVYDVKKVEVNCVEIIVCEDNFYGCIMGFVFMFLNEEYKCGFGLMFFGIVVIFYGDLEVLKVVIILNIVVFILELI